jgi:hypothetical protein
MTRDERIEEQGAAWWSFGMLLAVAIALAVFFYYVARPLITS